MKRQRTDKSFSAFEEEEEPEEEEEEKEEKFKPLSDLDKAYLLTLDAAEWKVKNTKFITLKFINIYYAKVSPNKVLCNWIVWCSNV